MMTIKATSAGPRPVKGWQGKMSKCLEDSDVTKVSTRELEEQVLSPNEDQHCARCEASKK